MLDHTVPAGIQDILTRQMDAWSRGDASAFVADYAPDATFVSVRGDMIQGLDAIEANHAFIFNGPYKGTKLREEVDHIRFPAPGVAVAHIAVEVSNVAAFPPGIPASGPGLLKTRFTFVLAENEGDWQITTAHNTIVVPQPPRS